MQTKETGKRKVVTYNLRISKAGGLADSEKDLEMLQQIEEIQKIMNLAPKDTIRYKKKRRIRGTRIAKRLRKENLL